MLPCSKNSQYLVFRISKVELHFSKRPIVVNVFLCHFPHILFTRQNRSRTVIISIHLPKQHQQLLENTYIKCIFFRNKRYILAFSLTGLIFILGFLDVSFCWVFFVRFFINRLILKRFSSNK